MPASLTVSAPGKALLVGGYLVLERPNAGLVLTTTSRFFSSLSWKPCEVRAAVRQTRERTGERCS